MKLKSYFKNLFLFLPWNSLKKKKKKCIQIQYREDDDFNVDDHDDNTEQWL